MCSHGYRWRVDCIVQPSGATYGLRAARTECSDSQPVLPPEAEQGGSKNHPGAASMIKAIQAKPITGMTLSPPPAQQSQSESIAAPAEVGQGLGTITCAACGSTNTEPCCHPAEFCQAICNDCNKPLNADGSVWVEKQEPTLEQFQRWLETEAHIVNSKYDEVLAGKGMSGNDWSKLTKRLANLRVGFALVMQFKLEQGA